MSDDERNGIERMIAAVFQLLIAAVLAWLGSQIIDNRETVIEVRSTQTAIVHEAEKLEEEVRDHEQRLRRLER